MVIRRFAILFVSRISFVDLAQTSATRVSNVLAHLETEIVYA